MRIRYNKEDPKGWIERNGNDESHSLFSLMLQRDKYETMVKSLEWHVGYEWSLMFMSAPIDPNIYISNRVPEEEDGDMNNPRGPMQSFPRRDCCW